MGIGDVIEHDVQRRSVTAPFAYDLFERHVRKRGSESDDALMRFIWELAKESGFFEPNRHAHLARAFQDAAHDRIAPAFLPDVNLAQYFARSERFVNRVDAVHHVVEIGQFAARAARGG
jgi:hypothetical protein